MSFEITGGSELSELPELGKSSEVWPDGDLAGNFLDQMLDVSDILLEYRSPAICPISFGSSCTA